MAQYLGAFLGSAIVFLVYWDAIVFYEHDRGGYRVTPDTAAIFGTFPAHHLTLVGGLTDQLVATALLLLCISAITDRNNMKVDINLLQSHWSSSNDARISLVKRSCYASSLMHYAIEIIHR